MEDFLMGKAQKNVGNLLSALSLATKAEKEEMQFPMK